MTIHVLSSRRLSILTLSVTLLIVRFWKSGRLWKDIFEKLPPQLQTFLRAQRIFRRLPFWGAPRAETEAESSTSNSITSPNTTINSNTMDSIIPKNLIHENKTNDRIITKIRQNHKSIRHVLTYWFGQYDPDEAQKKLWMIASSSVDLRKKVDAEIAHLFTPLLYDLAMANHEQKQQRQQQEKEELQQSNNTQEHHATTWLEWCTDSELYGFDGKIAAIIVLDQFSRHIRRHYESHNHQCENNPLLPSQDHLDRLALTTAQKLTTHHAQEIRCGRIPLPQCIFGLMPYRHANTLETVQYVQDSVEEAAKRNAQFEAMTSRFRKATNRRMAVLQDEARRKGKSTIVNTHTHQVVTPGGGEYMSVPLQVLQGTEAHDKMEEQFTDEHILETFPFDADFTEAPDHIVVKTIQAFLAAREIHPVTQVADDEKSKNDTKQQQNGGKKQKQSRTKSQPKSNDKKSKESSPLADPSTPCSILVSLSGGVDSMVIASVLSYLKTNGGYTNLDIHAIHIDYANRPESKAESDYVQHYCQRLGISFHVRRIEEVTRGITARDEYEKMSRQVRYDMYRKVARDCSNHIKEQTIVGVMLGHHRGDLRENVLSNAHKGCGPLDLSGMTPVSENDGVTIYRPLLPLEKADILNYAHQYGVPYFKDTTPHWSTRGKLRNKLLPLLEEIYGEGSMNNLSNLAVESDECRALLHNALLKPFMDTVVRKPMGIMFETAPFVAQARGVFFWKFVLREALHSAGLGMFSDKSVNSFLERIRPEHTLKKTVRPGWLQCRRDYGVYLRDDGRVFVFYPDRFPFRKSDAFKCVDTVAPMDKEFTTTVGPWTVNAGVWAVSGKEKANLIKKKAVPSLEQFMEGFVEYFLEVPTKPLDNSNGPEREDGDNAPAFRPMDLVFVESFTKNSRPPAWKNTYEKIEETLPVLGNTDESLAGLNDPKRNGFMHAIVVDGQKKLADDPVVLVRVTLDCRSSSG